MSSDSTAIGQPLFPGTTHKNGGQYFCYCPLRRCLDIEGTGQKYLDVYTLPAYKETMFTFIESSIFSRELANYLDDDEYGDLQQYLINYPEAGDIIPGSGGVRKLRWQRRGMGKRGGVRIIYYVMNKRSELWMLTLYAKSVHDNIPAHIVKAMKERV